MADFTKTITNALYLLGESPTSKYGQNNGFGYTAVFGTTKWSEGSFSLVFQVQKGLDNTLVVSGGEQGILFQKVITNTVSLVTFEAEMETLKNGTWDYIFVNNTTDAEQRDFTTFTSRSVSTTSFTCLAAGSTSWT